jgi:hypothetical protein
LVERPGEKPFDILVQSRRSATDAHTIGWHLILPSFPIRLPTCCREAVKLAGYWRTGAYRMGVRDRVGLLTQRGDIMVRYTGTIDAHRH